VKEFIICTCPDCDPNFDAFRNPPAPPSPAGAALVAHLEHLKERDELLGNDAAAHELRAQALSKGVSLDPENADRVVPDAKVPEIARAVKPRKLKDQHRGQKARERNDRADYSLINPPIFTCR
jgi:hypothetical protein